MQNDNTSNSLLSYANTQQQFPLSQPQGLLRTDNGLLGGLLGNLAGAPTSMIVEQPHFVSGLVTAEMKAAVKEQERLEKEAKKLATAQRKAEKEAREAEKAAALALIPPGVTIPRGPGRPKKLDILGQSLPPTPMNQSMTFGYPSASEQAPQFNLGQSYNALAPSVPSAPVSSPPETVVVGGHQYILVNVSDARHLEALEAQSTLAKRNLADQEDYFLDMVVDMRAEANEGAQKKMVFEGTKTVVANVLGQTIPILMGLILQRTLSQAPKVAPNMQQQQQMMFQQQQAQQHALQQQQAQAQAHAHQVMMQQQMLQPLPTLTSPSLEVQSTLREL